MPFSSWVPGLPTIPEEPAEEPEEPEDVPVPEGVEIAPQAQGSTSGSSNDDDGRSWFAKAKHAFRQAFRCHRPR